MVFHPEFQQWFLEQEPGLREALSRKIEYLNQDGPSLGRPHADHIKGCAVHNLKELRFQYRGDPWRVLFAFDPQRKSILLIGGNKRTDKRWYEKNIPTAIARLRQYLDSMEEW